MSVASIEEKYINLLCSIKSDTVFYGTVNRIKRMEQGFRVMIDLFNERTISVDDFLFESEQLEAVCYSFDLIIDTMNVTTFSQRQALYQFEIVDERVNGYDCVDAEIHLNIHRNYDRMNPYLNRKVTVKVTRADQAKRQKYQERLEKRWKIISRKSSSVERLSLSYAQDFNELVGVRYSQYFVGYGNCSYINLGDSSRGFFNIGYVKDHSAPVHHYTGFARHKPNWVIISSLDKENYNAALRYGNKHIFMCDWIFPNIKRYNFNLLRLFQCILLNGGRVYFLKYIANTSVFTIKHDAFTFEVYYQSDFKWKIMG